jgi:opacity protein-like surface antigen
MQVQVPEEDSSPRFIGNAGWIDSTKERWLATFRGRAGWTVSPQWLVFVTGGFAVAGMEATVNASGRFDLHRQENAIRLDRRRRYRVGISHELIAKVEYLYVRLEDAVFFENACGGSGAILGACGTPPPAPGPRFVPLDDHIVRAGLNFHFWTPVPPAPAVAVKGKY